MKMPEYVAVKIMPDKKGTSYNLEVVTDADFVNVVRCRDCKHKRMVLKSGCLGCDIQCCLHPFDWYCPDGEKVTE